MLRPREVSALRTCRAYTFFPNVVPSWHQQGPTAFRKHCTGVCSLEEDGELSSPAMALGLARCFSFPCLHFGLWDFLELSFMFKKDSGGLPGGPVVTTPCFRCRERRLDSWLGNCLCAVQCEQNIVTIKIKEKGFCSISLSMCQCFCKWAAGGGGGSIASFSGYLARVSDENPFTFPLFCEHPLDPRHYNVCGNVQGHGIWLYRMGVAIVQPAARR